MTASEDSQLALIEVRVYYRGVAHRTALQVTDGLPATFVHSLLTHATDEVRNAINKRQTEEWAKAEAEEAEKVRRFSELTNKLDAPLLPAPAPKTTELSDLPARGGQCRAIVVGKSGRRRPCGVQLNPDGVCPDWEYHVQAKPEHDDDLPA
jgi:hypothetical protein